MKEGSEGERGRRGEGREEGKLGGEIGISNGKKRQILPRPAQKLSILEKRPRRRKSEILRRCRSRRLRNPKNSGRKDSLCLSLSSSLSLSLAHSLPLVQAGSRLGCSSRPAASQRKPRASTLNLSFFTDSEVPLLAQRRHVRSKIRWFAEFCNSHHVSHFAAFFIVARA